MSRPGRRGTPFVVAAPSGTGKTSVCRAVVESGEGVEFSVSHTTRAPRPGERDGRDYHFVGRDEFQRLVDEGAFLEHAEYNGNRYGTSWRAIREPLAAGRDVLLEIEIQGARQVRERLEGARFVFLLPPSLAALEQRLRGRGTDDEEQIRARLELARRELEAAPEFDFAVVNDEIGRCVAEVLEIVRGARAGGGAERALRRRFAPDAALGRLADRGD